MSWLRCLVRAGLGAALVATPSVATIVNWSGTLELDFGKRGTAPGFVVPVVGGGTAVVNNSGPVGTSVTGIRSLVFPGGAFAASVSVPVYNATALPIVNYVLNLTNAPILVSKGRPCSNAQHSAVGQGGPYQPTGSGPGAHGIFCANGPFAVSGTGGLVGSAFLGLFGPPGNPIANVTVPLTPIGAGSTASASNPLIGVGVFAAGMEWLTGVGRVRYVDTTPGGLVTFTTTVTSRGSFVRGTGTTAMIQLVSPLSLQLRGVGPLPLPSFARITATLFGLPPHVPEPGMLGLLGAGLAALALAGRRRTRR